ncbi:MAG: hypothetical protein AAB772_03315 [Patescibacteria group bacterium]
MLKKLIGRTIVECRESGTGFVMKLDNGEKVTVAVDLEGGPGADGQWYEWGVLRVDGERVGDRA